MSKLFDEIFTKRVNDVFNNHEEEYNSSDWGKLQFKMNKPKRGLIVVWPHIAKAASIVMFLGIAVFSVNKYEKTPALENNEREIISSRIKGTNESVKLTNNELYTNNVPSTEYIANTSTKNEQKKHEDINSEEDNPLRNEIIEVSVNSASFSEIGNDRFGDVKKDLDDHHNEIAQMDSSKSNFNKPVLRVEDDFIIAENNEKKEKRFGLGVELASVSNYSMEGTSDGVNLSGGLTVAYNVTDKVSFTTGVIIAKQSVNYVGERQNEMAYSDLNSAFVDNRLSKVENMTSSDSEVSFIAIDIPLNIRFKHKRVSFTTGFSSLLYVQEKYSYSYNAVVSNSVYNSEAKGYEVVVSNSTVSNDETTTFSHFDLARLLNISVGYDIPLTKGNLVVEPYLKYPLGSISSKEIFMGAGGFAFRYNF